MPGTTGRPLLKMQVAEPYIPQIIKLACLARSWSCRMKPEFSVRICMICRATGCKIDHIEAGVRKQFFNSMQEIVRTLDSKGNDVTVVRDSDNRVTEVLLNGHQVEAFTYDDRPPPRA